MILSICHETIYRYTAPLSYTIAHLRLWPRDEPQQRILDWQIESPGTSQPFNDAYGNHCHMLTVRGAHQEVRTVASGSIESYPLSRGRLSARERLSPLVFTVPTALTGGDQQIADFAARHLKPRADSETLLGLAEGICAAVAYESGATESGTGASHALALGKGVCQDHAHLFIACCHTLAIPARYVSGYIDPGGSGHADSHAWVDAWVDETDFSGWVSIDVTHARWQDDSYCRLAVGRDYDSAGPVRGMRRGGGQESLSVSVLVTSGDFPVKPGS